MFRLLPDEILPLFRKHGKHPEHGRIGGINSDSCCGIGIFLLDQKIDPYPRYNPDTERPAEKPLWPVPGASPMYLQGYWRGFDCFGLMDQFVDGARTQVSVRFRASPDFLQGMKDGRDLLELCRKEFPEWWPIL